MNSPSLSVKPRYLRHPSAVPSFETKEVSFERFLAMYSPYESLLPSPLLRPGLGDQRCFCFVPPVRFALVADQRRVVIDRRRVLKEHRYTFHVLPFPFLFSF